MEYIIMCQQFLIESIIYYLIFHRESITNYFKKETFKNVVMFSLLSTSIMTLSYYFLPNKVFIRLISTIVFMIYLGIESHSKKKLKLIFTYSCFTNFLMECIHFISYRLIFINTYDLRINNKISDSAGWTMILVLYIFISLIIYKFNLINIEEIRKMSKHIIGNIISFVLLIMIVAFKYFCKNFYSVDSLQNWLIASDITLFIIEITILAVIIINKKVEKMNKAKNNTIKNKIDKNIEYVCNKIGISVDEYRKQSKIFINKLNKLRINSGFEGFAPMILSLIIIKNHHGRCIKLRRDVYPIVSDVTGINAENIDKNIKTCICKAWDKFDEDLFIEEYGKPISSSQGEPSVKDFLITICESISSNVL